MDVDPFSLVALLLLLVLTAIFADVIAPFRWDKVLNEKNTRRRDPPCIHFLGCPAEKPQHLMGMEIPRVTVRTEPVFAQFGVGGTSATTDISMSRFVEVLPLLAELAELENAVIRLARELRKTQRRCNALSKIFMPDYRETISYITGSLEERERESFVILKMIRDRLGQ